MWPLGDDLPSELRDLLSAQAVVSEDFPYDLLQVRRPPLSRIYVRQVLRRREVERREPDRREHRDTKDSRDSREPESPEPADEVTVEEVMTVTEALDANEHLLITGAPGAGKSTVGRVFCKVISDHLLRGGSIAPLREAVVPLRIPAQALVTQEAWSTALAQGAKQVLRQRLFTAPEPGLFAGRVLGVRWLVFIDGLDEIADEATTREVVRVIASRAQRGTDYRLVITTRRLGEALMRILTDARIATMNLEPFAQEQLDEFAAQWFREQDPISGGRDQAREFLRQTADGRLRELVRTPLLATIAAVTFTRHPDRPLPSNTVDLFQQFTTSLLDEQVSGRNIIGELRRVLDARPARLRLAEWVGERRFELFSHLGHTRLASDAPLAGAAEQWVAERQTDLPDGWQQDLYAILSGSGLVTELGDELSFWHQSFADYLAAQHYASTLTADPAELGRWVEHTARQPSSDDVVRFTLVLWGRRPGNDLAGMVRRLLDGDEDRVELAARLLADGATVPEPLAEEVAARILNLVLLAGKQFGELLGSLDKRVAGQLHDLVDRPEVTIAARVECAIALGRLSTPEYAARKLEQLGEVVPADSLARVVEGLTELVPDGAARAERFLVPRLAAPLYDAFGAAAECLVDLGATEALGAAVREIVGDAQRGAVDGFGWWRLPDDCEIIARLALRCEALEHAEWAARLVLVNSLANESEVAGAAEILAVVSDVDEVMAAVMDRAASHRLRAAAKLADGHPDLAESLIRSVLDDPAAPLSEVIQAGTDLLVEGRLTADELLTRLDREPTLIGEHLYEVAKALADNDQTNQAVEVGWRVLADPTSDQTDFAWGVALMFKLGADPARILATIPRRPLHFQTSVVEHLCDEGQGPVAAMVTRELLHRRIEDADYLLDIVPHLVEARERDAAELVLDTGARLVDRSSSYGLTKLARALLVLGRRTEAATAARNVVALDMDSSYTNREAIRIWLDAVGSGDVVAELLKYPPRSQMRTRLAEVLAERGLGDQATTVWLDQLTHTGTEPDIRLQAAVRLVGCGQRQRAVQALDDALRRSPRIELRPLLGWVHLSDLDATPNELIGMLHAYSDRFH